MTASERLADPAQASPRSQRRRTAADGAVDFPTSTRTTRATRTPNKTTGLQVNNVEDKDTLNKSKKRKKIEAVITEEVPLAQPEGATAHNTKHRKEVKQATEVTQEQEPQAGGSKVEGDQEPVDPQVDGDTVRTAKRKRIVKAEEAEVEVSELSPKKTKQDKATEVEIGKTVEDGASPKKARRSTKVKDEDEEVEEGEESPKKTKRRRKTKEEKEKEAMPLAARTEALRMFIGAHVSGAKGWSFSIYIAAVELRLYYEFRSSQFSHKLRAYWVNSLQIL